MKCLLLLLDYKSMKLYPKGVDAPAVTTSTVTTSKKTAIKTYIKSLDVPDEGFYYDELVKEVQAYYEGKTEYYTNDTILECLKEVDAEWHPVEEE